MDDAAQQVQDTAQVCLSLIDELFPPEGTRAEAINELLFDGVAVERVLALYPFEVAAYQPAVKAFTRLPEILTYLLSRDALTYTDTIIGSAYQFLPQRYRDQCYESIEPIPGSSEATLLVCIFFADLLAHAPVASFSPAHLLANHSSVFQKGLDALYSWLVLLQAKAKKATLEQWATERMLEFSLHLSPTGKEQAELRDLGVHEQRVLSLYPLDIGEWRPAIEALTANVDTPMLPLGSPESTEIEQRVTRAVLDAKEPILGLAATLSTSFRTAEMGAAWSSAVDERNLYPAPDLLELGLLLLAAMAAGKANPYGDGRKDEWFGHLIFYRGQLESLLAILAEADWHATAAGSKEQP